MFQATYGEGPLQDLNAQYQSKKKKNKCGNALCKMHT